MSDTTTPESQGLTTEQAGEKIAALMTGKPASAAPASSKDPAPVERDDNQSLSPSAPHGGAHDARNEHSQGDDDLGQSESDATEQVEHELDDDNDADEQNESDAIVPPKSLKNPEDQEAFRKLPPDAQKLFSKLHDIRESEQNKHFDRRMQEVAAQSRQLQAHAEAANAERADREQRLQTLAAMTIPQIQELQKVDWDELAHYNRDEYIRLSHVANTLNQRVQTINQELQKVQNEKAMQFKQASETHVLQQVQAAFETIPEWQMHVDERGVPTGFKDEAKGKSLTDGINDLLAAHGLAEQASAVWQDVRIVRLLREAALLRQEKAARQAAQGKKTGAPAPRFMSPSTPTQHADSKTRRYKERQAAFQKSGSIEDAGQLIGMLLQ